MSYVDNTQIKLSSILTYLGREKFRQGNFIISKFAISDSEIDYGMNASNIQYTPILESSPNELFNSSESIRRKNFDVSKCSIKLNGMYPNYMEVDNKGFTLKNIKIQTINYEKEPYDIYTSDASVMYIELESGEEILNPLNSTIKLTDNDNNPIAKECYYRSNDGKIVWKVNNPYFYGYKVSGNIASEVVKKMEQEYLDKVLKEGKAITFKIIGVNSGAVFSKDFIIKPINK